MKTRKLGPFDVSAIGLGCMSLAHAYGVPPDAEYGARLLHRALDIGYNFLDTASVYGMGASERLIGEALKPRRDEFVLASKCGLGPDADGQRLLSGRPDFIRWSCDQSLKRLQVEVIDLFYLHRLDAQVPIEESVGALGDLVRAGKVRTIGLSEVSAQTLGKGHKEFPITALQSEYSLWTRNPEVATLKACAELDIAFVAFSPVARGFLTSSPPDPANLFKSDMRQHMPRFQGEAFEANLKLLQGFNAVAGRVGCTPAQLSLAWVLQTSEHVIPIPGTGSIPHLEENAEADQIELSPQVLEELDLLINARTVTGHRYGPAMLASIDTEEVPDEER
jgi:aryl-alcohol dehydrogenase-like predicted oxidoreductase